MISDEKFLDRSLLNCFLSLADMSLWALTLIGFLNIPGLVRPIYKDSYEIAFLVKFMPNFLRQIKLVEDSVFPENLGPNLGVEN